MRFLIILSLIIFCIGCSRNTNDTMRLSGSIDHPDENLTLTLYRGTTLLRHFMVESDGTFDDRFVVEEELHLSFMDQTLRGYM